MPTGSRLPEARRSAAWAMLFPIQYRLIRLLDPLVRLVWRWFGLGNVVELRVPGRRTGLQRPVLLGLLRAEGRWFLGHPNGDVSWTRNLEAAGDAELAMRPGAVLPVRARRLPAGPVRDSAIASTGQHLFPGNVLYRLARPHIRAVGAYFLLEVAAARAAGESAPPADRLPE